MSKQKWINLVSAYSIIYTVITLLNSVLYLCNGIYEDPSGNWHELDRAIILLIGVAAFELCTSLPIKPLILRYVVAYIPSQLLAFAYVWFTSLREPLAKTADRQKSDMILAEQKKNDLVMYLAHDLKTPLASSISCLNLLRDEKQLSGELREKYLAIALAKSERLKNLINEFLEIARYSLSTITLQYSEIKLTRLLEQLVYEFQPVLDKKSLSCCLVAGDDILLNCDADKMQRVFDNLLRNAVNYSFDGTEITIEAESGEDSVRLRFSNHGGTIPKEKLERIFEQFYRLDTGRSSSGAGLGLAIAKQIVTLHKGTITAESGGGLTVFTVMLPV